VLGRRVKFRREWQLATEGYTEVQIVCS